MANEAVIVSLYGQPKGCPVNFKCADGVAIEKGTLLKLSGGALTEVTPSVATDANVPFAGIAAAEKVANDGSTTIGVWTKGIFDITNNAVEIDIGKMCKISGANLVRAAADGDYEAGAVVGKVLEPMAASEVAQVAIGTY